MAERSDGERVQPPPAPQVPTRTRIPWGRAAGLAVLALLPVLALFGVFGDARAETSASSGNLELHVRYPTRFRYKTIDAISVRVTNTSGQALDRIMVRFDEEYISQFSNVVFTPQVKRPYEVELTSVSPGETRLVFVEIQAENYWRHSGTITAGAGDESARVNLSTTVFP